MNLTEKDKEKIIQCLNEDKPIPSLYKQKLFKNDDIEYVESTKDYKLVYKGKERKEDIIANTPAAPLQKMRSFNAENEFDEDWSNMLIFGDNLLALKAIYKDQRGLNKYKTKNKIKLIYIDPPFATKQDFMKDREKAYRDKVIGAKFIEFLRKRLILLREILADDGAIYVHLDWKKGHYIKTILDEVFGENNFQNEIVWHYSGWNRKMSSFFNNRFESIYYYKKSDEVYFDSYTIPWESKSQYVKKRKQQVHTDEDGKEYVLSDAGGGKRVKRYLNEAMKMGRPIDNVWDLDKINNSSNEHIDYPTQKPEKLLERIIKSSSKEGDIVLDCFAGSGTASSVSEKLNRKWIAMDCGKLSIYTIQKRLFNLDNEIGTTPPDDSDEYERINDLSSHSRARKSRGYFWVSEKARKGELEISDNFLKKLSEFLTHSFKDKKLQDFSLLCPKDKFKVKKFEVIENENNSEAKAGDKVVQVDNVRFLISFVKDRNQPDDPKPLKAKEFTLYNSGIYDSDLILEMDWEKYRPFVAQLFEVRLDKHKIHSFKADGYIGIHSAYIWDYPNHKELILDEEYVHSLHQALGGKAGEKFYVITPICSLGFMQDEIKIDNTTYVFLKVPLSILMELINKGEPGALKQPTSEDDVNEVMDAVGFDFISQPIVKANYIRATPENKNLFNVDDNDYVIEMKEFKSDTLAYDPEEFDNFETFSMVMVDTDYNEEYFNLSKVFWADDVVDEEEEKAIIRIKEDEFHGEKMMVIYMDKYGNELKIKVNKTDFK